MGDNATGASARKEAPPAHSRRAPRTKLSISLSPAVYAEMVLMADRCDVSYGQLVEAALARFFLIRGIRLEGLWDDPELVAALAAAHAAGAPQR